MFIIIPIYSDGFLHPFHKNNKLSLIYVRHISDKTGDIINVSHPDTVYNNRKLEEISKDTSQYYITTNKKHLMNIFPNMQLMDVNFMHWWKYNVPMNFDEIRINAYDFFNNKYYNVRDVNQIIPLIKHKEYCDMVFDKIINFVENDHIIDNYESIHAYHSIEKNGIKVSKDVCEIFDDRVLKHISDGKLYSDYNMWTSTGRPSNSFGTINFAALPPEKRKAIINWQYYSFPNNKIK